MFKASPVGAAFNYKEAYRNLPKSSLKGIKLLFIDDDYVNYIYFHEMLKPSGVIVERAISLPEAVYKLKTSFDIRIAIISLTDINNSNQDIIRSVKGMFPELPILTITDRQYTLKQDYFTAGCDSYINRHTDFDQLVNTIEDLLEEKSIAG
ncbi:MAG: response regulator [Bacteroidales bacterium]|nr:response regulator [Bacteroidales bacterium]